MTNEEAIAYGKRVIGLGLNDETQAFCESAIKALQERKTGKWVKDEYGTDHCSCCSYIPAYDTAIDDIFYSPFCPLCGAKMEVEDEMDH